MLRIEIVNDGTANRDPENMAYPPNDEPFCIVGNYDYKIFVNQKVVASGRLEGFNRITGWPGLLSFLNKEINGDRFTS